jgi:hypothetical protein
MPNGIKDVVGLIPGISGSVLERDGKDVWASSPGAALRAVLSLGSSIRGLSWQVMIQRSTISATVWYPPVTKCAI